MDPAETKNMPAIIGKWHLLDIAADETNIPQHRMDLVFHDQSCGAILRRDNVEEVLLAAVQFDGTILRLQMAAPSGNAQAEVPWLSMVLTGVRFEGFYQDSVGASVGCKLKLVRAKQ
jgi:hypothetical protein